MLCIDDLFAKAAISRAGCVRWGTEIPLESAGVYVVATTPDGGDSAGLDDAPLNDSAIDTLLKVRPEATVDGQPADAELLKARLAEMWIAGQPILYIGLAGTSVRHRVKQFYSTAIGARAPHAGGWPVKMLSAHGLWVHYGASADPDSVELAMIQTFVDSVPAEARNRLVDPAHPLPFANLTVPRGPRKRHGLAGVKAPKSTSTVQEARLPQPVAVTVAPAATTAGPLLRGVRSTQNVTEKDIANGQLRVPALSKDIFPAEKAIIRVRLGSSWYTATWNPRFGPDRERSGTVRVAKGELEGLGFVGGPRRITATEDGYRIE